jgi:N12 class adenine-specific DNA methylase
MASLRDCVRRMGKLLNEADVQSIRDRQASFGGNEELAVADFLQEIQYEYDDLVSEVRTKAGVKGDGYVKLGNYGQELDSANQTGTPDVSGPRGIGDDPLAGDNTGNLEAGQSEIPQGVDGQQPTDASGIRGPDENVGEDGRADGSGVSGDGREGASGTGRADAGTGSAVKDPNTVSPGNPGVGNYQMSDPLQVVGGGQVARFNKNKASIELFNDLRDEGRGPTKEEQEILAGYTGWGSFGQELFQGTWSNGRPKEAWEKRDTWLRDNLTQEEWEGVQRSITNSHYTDPPTVMAMWSMLERMGFSGGRILEPSMGIGNFFAMMPPEIMNRSLLGGIELDPVTGGMAEMLYPDASVNIMGYQESKTPDDFYDVVIGNWPFENTVIADRRYNQLSPLLHDYFFLKAMDQVRPGGIVMGITSNGTMDKKSSTIRTALAKKGELIAAFRLPTGAFKEYAGTSVVTDIVILRKRQEPMQLVADEGWIKSVPFQTPNGEVYVNEYYKENPRNVIGKIDFGSGTTRGRPGLIVNRPQNMKEQIERIIDMVPEESYQEKTQADNINYVTNHTDDREGSLTYADDGFFIVRGEFLAPAGEVKSYSVKSEKITKDRESQFRRLIDMREAYARLIEADRGTSDVDAEPLRKELKKQFDVFNKVHGDIEKSFGLKYLKRIDDPFYPSIAALQIDGKEAQILTESTTRTTKTMRNPSVSDAFVIARNSKVNPTVKDIAALSNRAEADVKAELIGNGAVYELLNGDIVPTDVYLSGNVRQKLRQAQASREEGGEKFQRNVDALSDVLPATIPYFTIEAQLGATWVPTGVYEEYIAHMLNNKDTKGISVRYNVGRWKADISIDNKRKPEASTGFGTLVYDFKKLVNAAISNQVIQIKGKNEDGSTFVDVESTKEANAKVADMREKFGEWLWSDPLRRVTLEEEYNESRNSYSTPTFDGSFLTFEGMALSLGEGPFDLRKHQRDAIWRGVVTGKSLNAHEVGTGKTFTIGGIAIESRRYGLAKKPMILAHNANSKSVASEIQQMYPSAKILYINNLSAKNIDIKMRQIANDDWDAIVIPHSLIGSMSFKEETLMAMAKEEIANLEAEAMEAAEEDGHELTEAIMNDEEELKKLRSPTAKELVKQRNKIIESIKRQAQRSSREGATAFEDLGIDMILVDEAHEFKKPPISTRMKMKGLNTGVSQRSIQLNFITKYIRSTNNGRNIHLFTGTPVTNTLTEVFHMMRYIMQEEMQDAGLDQWDGWFGSFAKEVQDVELSASSEYETVVRLAGFINVPELRRMFGQYMDVVFSDDMPEMQPRKTKSGKILSDPTLTESENAELLNGRTEKAKDRPYKKVIVDNADLTSTQKRWFAQIQQWAKDFRSMSGKQKRETMLSGGPESPIIYENVASKVSFDARLVDGEKLAGQEGFVNDDENSKASRVVRNIKEVYDSSERAAQVVFTDKGISKTAKRRVGPVGERKDETYKTLSTVQDIVERLVATGIPRDQIATIDGSTNKDKRKAIADAMNNLTVRVVIGSSQALGVGVNMQRNLRAMHHMDAPWMPGDLEQRNGRGWRQGNQWNTVLEYRYLTDRLDGRRWQVLAIKQRFINAFLKSDDTQRSIEGDAASDEESDILTTFSEAAGDPRILIREKFKKEITQLQGKERMHNVGVADAIQQKQYLESSNEKAMDRASKLEKSGVLEAVNKIMSENKGDGFTIKIGKKKITDRKKAMEVINKFITDKMRVGTEPTILGSFGGHDLYIQWKNLSDRPNLSMDVNGERIVAQMYSVSSMENTLRNYGDKIEAQNASIEESKKSIERLDTVSKEPFRSAEKLINKEKDLKSLDADIGLNPVPPPSWLRSGAPVDTEVIWNDKTFVVSGHRWTNDGYYVIAGDDKGSVTIPYTEAMDAQGMALYEEREFEKPELIEKEEEKIEGLDAKDLAAIKRLGDELKDEGKKGGDTDYSIGYFADDAHFPTMNREESGGFDSEKVSKIKSPTMIIRALRDHFKMPVRQGRISKAGARGTHGKKSGVIRLQKMGEIKTFAHELGHALESISGQTLTNLISGSSVELLPLVEEQNMSASDKQNLREAFASYSSLWMLNKPFVDAKAPEFTKMFDDYMAQNNPDHYEMLNSAREMYQEYLRADPGTAVAANMATGDKGPLWNRIKEGSKPEAFKDMVGSWFRQVYTNRLDSLHPVKVAVERLKKLHDNNHDNAIDLKMAEDAYVLFRNSKDAYSSAHVQLEKGIIPYGGIYPEGPSFSSVMKLAMDGDFTSDKVEAFGAYLISRRGVHAWNRYDLGIIPREPGPNSESTYQRTIDDMEREFPEFVGAAKELYVFQDNLLKKKYDAGFLTKEQYESALIDHVDYVPWMRDRTDVSGGVGSFSNSGSTKMVNRMSGSDRSIINPLESIVADVYETQNMIMGNDGRKALVDLAKNAGYGYGNLVEQIPDYEIQAHSVSVGEVGNALVNQIDWDGYEDRDVQTLEALIEGMDDIDGAALTFYRAGQMNERGEPIIYVWRGGKREAYRLADGDLGVEIYESITKANVEQVSDLTNLLGVPAATLRLGVTLEPTFQVSNTIRGELTAWSLDPDYMLGRDFAKGLSSVINFDLYKQAYIGGGGIMGGINANSLGAKRAQKDIEKLTREGMDIRRMSFKQLLTYSEVSESAMRIGLFRVAFERAKKSGLNDKEAVTEAVFVARDITDYGMHGSKMVAAQRLITFMNAHFQGVTKWVKVLGGAGAYRKAINNVLNPTEKQKYSRVEEEKIKASRKLYVAMVTFGMISAAFALMYRDDEEYQNISDYLKSGHWVVKLGDKWVVIPKPFQEAILGNIFERAIEAKYHNDPTAYDRLMTGLSQLMIPPSMPVVAKPILEHVMNESLYNGMPLVPRRMQGIDAEEQFNSWTSSFSKMLGGAIGVSPIIIDHYIVGWTGSLGRTALGLTTAVDPKSPEQGMDDMFFLRRFVRDWTRSSKSTANFYEKINRDNGTLNAKYETFKRFVDDESDDQARAYLSKMTDSDATYVMAKYSYAGKLVKKSQSKFHPMIRAVNVSSKLYSLKRDVRNSEKLVPGQKRLLDDAISQRLVMEFHNAMVVTKQSGYQDRQLFDLEANFKQIEKVSKPTSETLLDMTAKIVTAKDSYSEYPELEEFMLILRDEVLAGEGDINDQISNKIDVKIDDLSKKVR